MTSQSNAASFDDTDEAPRPADPEPTKTPRRALTFDERVERLLTPQRNDYERKQKRYEKLAAELRVVEQERDKAKTDYDRAKRMAISTAEQAGG
jgi:hypothetical protein